MAAARAETFSQDAIAAAATHAGADLPVVSSDIHASEDYRRAMIPVFTRRALEAAIARL